MSPLYEWPSYSRLCPDIVDFNVLIMCHYAVLLFDQAVPPSLPCNAGTFSPTSVYDEASCPLRCETLTPTMFAGQIAFTECVVQTYDIDEPPRLMDMVSSSY